MVSSRPYLIVAAFSTLVACQSQGGKDTCYFPDGTVDTESVPCNNDINGFGNCCPSGSACMSSTPFCLWLGDWTLDRWSFTNSSVLRDSAPCFFEPGNAHADMAPCLPNSDGSIKYCCGNALGCCNNSTKQGSWTLENKDPGSLSVVGSTASVQNATVTMTVTQTVNWSNGSTTAACSGQPTRNSQNTTPTASSSIAVSTGAASSIFSAQNSRKLLSAVAAAGIFLL